MDYMKIKKQLLDYAKQKAKDLGGKAEYLL